MIAAISSEVATGRRIKMRDGFTLRSTTRRARLPDPAFPGVWGSAPAAPQHRWGLELLAGCTADGSLAAPPALAARPFGRGRAAAVRAPARSRDAHFSPVTQSVGAVYNDELP